MERIKVHFTSTLSFTYLLRANAFGILTMPPAARGIVLYRSLSKIIRYKGECTMPTVGIYSILQPRHEPYGRFRVREFGRFH